MAFDTFVPARMPVVGGAPRSASARVREATFGDGYVQRAPDGLNPIARTMPLSWPQLKVSDAAAIEAFIVAHVAIPFLFKPPGEPAALQWTCKKWSRVATANYREAMTAELVQDFTIAGAIFGPGLDFTDSRDSQYLPGL